MKVKRVLGCPLLLIFLVLPACDLQQKEKEEESHHEKQKVVLTRPLVKNMVVAQQYVCQIHSQRHIEVQAWIKEPGLLEPITIKEGQEVKKGDVLFQINPTMYKAKLDAEMAEAQLAQQEYNNQKSLFNDSVVSKKNLLLFEAKLEKARAKAKLAQAELDFATVRAPFDGIVDRLHVQQGSLVKEGHPLTTLSDNSVMWVYFNFPEARYLEYMAELGKSNETQKIELILADGSKYKYEGKMGPIGSRFNSDTGNVLFRADFPNPERLLRYGQTGNILISKIFKNAVIIPQRATFETLDRRYVWVVSKEEVEVKEGKEGKESKEPKESKEVKKVEKEVVRQREITIQNELDDIFIIKSGLKPSETIVFEGVRQVHDGEALEEPLFIPPEKAMENLKHHAE